MRWGLGVRAHREQSRATERALTAVEPAGWAWRGCIFAGALAVYTCLAAPIPFYDKGEPREALVVRSIVNGGDAVLPRPDGRNIAAKPPLFHWLASVPLRAGLRPEELAIRAPSIVAGAAGVAISASVGAGRFGRPAGLLTAVILGTAFEWQRAATQARVDMVLTLCVLVTILVWRAGLEQPGRRALIRVGYVAAALAVLTKGPVGIVLPLLVVIVDGLAREGVASLRPLVDVPGIAIALCLIGSWYGLAWLRAGHEFTHLQVVHENVARFIGWGKVAHAHGRLYYGGALAGGLLPWTIFVPGALLAMWRRSDRFSRFLVLWAVVVLGFFSLAAGKRSVYLLPLYPPVALLIGASLAGSLARRPARPLRIGLYVAAAVVAAVGLGIGLDGGPALAHALATRLEGSDRVRVPAAVAVLSAYKWEAVVMLFVVATASVGLARTERTSRRMGALLTVALIWSVGIVGVGTTSLAARLSPRDDAVRLRPVVSAAPGVCARGYVDHAFRYYIGRPIAACSAQSRVEGTVVVESTFDAGRGARRYALRPGTVPR